MNENNSKLTVTDLYERVRLLELENIELRIALDSVNGGAKDLNAPAFGNEDLLLMLNSTGEGLFTIDLNGNCAFVNQSGLQLLGYTDKMQLVGRNMHDLMHHSLPSGKPLHPQNCSITNTLFSNKGIHEVTEVFWRADGTSFPCEYFSFPMLANGSCVGAVVTFIDITNRKMAELALIESEERFRRYVNSTSDIVYTLDAQQRHTGIYGDWAERMGYSKEFFLGKTIVELINKEAEPHEIANRAALKGQFVVYESQKKIHGKKMYFQTSLSPIYQKGEVVGLIAVGRDISKLVESQKIIKSSEAQLKKLNATKDKLFSIIAHDLYNPFNTILGFTHLLQQNIQSYDPVKSNLYLEHIQGATKNALLLLNNLLDWWKAQTGNLSYKPAHISLSLIVTDVIQNLNDSAVLKSISLTYAEPSPIDVYADSTLLKTIIRNLITNAIKFTNTSGTIEISANIITGYIEIEVADDGVGMDAATLARLFVVGANESMRGTASEKGSGLGLILCKEFVEMHGGQIWAVSKLGVGSTFKFTLPNIELEA